jgi:hypothetical protein
MCANLEAISDTLFANNPIKDAKYLFGNTHITSAGILRCFAGKSLNYDGMSYIFNSAHYITEITEEDLTGITFSSYGLDNYNYAFSSMSSLQHMTVPADVQYLGQYAISGSNIEWVEFKGTTPPGITTTTFGNSDYPIYVPDSAVDTYKAASVWSNLADRILPVSERI